MTVARGRIVVHTDLFVDYLRHRSTGPSVLRQLAARYLCYATVIGAAELFALAATKRQRDSVEDALNGVKILGINARSAKLFGALMRRYRGVPPERLMIAGMCIESRLPLVTGHTGKFEAIRELTLLDASSLI